MPAYRKQVLSDADLADLYAYLQSIPKALSKDDPAAQPAVTTMR